MLELPVRVFRDADPEIVTVRRIFRALWSDEQKCADNSRRNPLPQVNSSSMSCNLRRNPIPAVIPRL
jgi:hypothetical protein